MFNVISKWLHKTRFAYEKRYFNVNNFIYNKLSNPQSTHWCNIDKYAHRSCRTMQRIYKDGF